MADACRGARVGVLAGGRLLDEDAYALSKLARTVLRTNDLDHRRAPHGGSAERWAAAGADAVTYRDIERAGVIVVAGLDAEQEVPILHLRLRKAAARGARIVVLAPRRTRLHDVAEHLLVRPGAEAATLAAIGRAPTTTDAGSRAARGRRPRDRPGGCAAGGARRRRGRRPRGRATPTAPVSRGSPGAPAITAPCGRRAPCARPGRTRLDVTDERAELEAVWGPVMTEAAGRDTTAILRAAADHELDVLYLVGVDPLRDAPDAALARRALQNVGTVVVQSMELGDLGPYVSVVPAGRVVPRARRAPERLGGPQPAASRRCAPPPGSAGRTGRSSRGSRPPPAAIWASTRWTSCTRRWPVCGRRASSTVTPASAPAPAPVDGLTLTTYHLLVDEGRMSEGADELKATLAEPAFAEMHPSDAGAHGLADGLGVRLRTAAGEAVVPLRVTEHIAPGTVFVPFNQPGLAANTLLSGRSRRPSRSSRRRRSRRHRGAGGRRRGSPVTWIDWGILSARSCSCSPGSSCPSCCSSGWSARSSPTCRRARARCAPVLAVCCCPSPTGIKLFFKEAIPPDPGRPPGLPAGADLRDDPRIPRLRGRPVRPLGAHLRTDGRRCSWPTCPWACCGCSR